MDEIARQWSFVDLINILYLCIIFGIFNYIIYLNLVLGEGNKLITNDKIILSFKTLGKRRFYTVHQYPIHRQIKLSTLNQIIFILQWSTSVGTYLTELRSVDNGHGLLEINID